MSQREVGAILQDLRGVQQLVAQDRRHTRLLEELTTAIAQNASAEQRAKEVRRADSKRAEEEKEALVQRHGAQLKSLLALALADADMHLVATDDTRVRAQKSVLVKAIPYIAHQDEFQVGGSAGAVRLLVALLYCGTDFPLDGIAADVLIETCELVTEWFDPLEARAVLGKLSEPLVATANESVAGAIAVLAAAERRHVDLLAVGSSSARTRIDPNYRFWKQASDEAKSAIVNFDGAIPKEELGKLSLASLCGLLKLVKPKEVSLTVKADLRSKEFTSGDKCIYGPAVLASSEGADESEKYSFQLCCSKGNNPASVNIGIKTIGDGYFVKGGLHAHYELEVERIDTDTGSGAVIVPGISRRFRVGDKVRIIAERPGDRSGILVGDICVIVADDNSPEIPFKVKKENASSHSMGWCKASQIEAAPTGPEKTHQRVVATTLGGVGTVHTNLHGRHMISLTIAQHFKSQGGTTTRDMSELVRHLSAAMDSGDLPKKPVVDLLAAHMRGEFDKTQLATQLKAQVGESAFNEAIQKTPLIPVTAASLVATINVKLTVSEEQRQFELFNDWVVASGTAPGPLTPAVALLCVRSIACGFGEIDKMDALARKVKLRELDSVFWVDEPLDGLSDEELEVRLKDALATCKPCGDAVKLVCKSFAKLVGARFDVYANDGSLTDLDAASFSEVLALDTLRTSKKDNARRLEKDILDEAMKWASVPGRSGAMIAKVMPLVGFPLVPMLTYLNDSPELKALVQRNSTVAGLVKDALNQQLGKKRERDDYSVLDGVLPQGAEVPRTKKRKYCHGDKVPEANADGFMRALLGTAGPSAGP